MNRIKKRLQKADEYLKKDDLSNSEKQAKRALRILNRPPKKPKSLIFSVGAILNDIGAHYLASGKFEKATSNLKTALNLKLKSVGRKHKSTIGTLENLVVSSTFSCDFELAKKCICEILKLSSELGNANLGKRIQKKKKILEDIIENKPSIFFHATLGNDRFTIPTLENINLPTIFEGFKATVKKIQVESIGYETLCCSVCFNVSLIDQNESNLHRDPYFNEEWKINVPPHIKSRIANSSDNFVIFVEENMNFRRDQLNLFDDKGQKIKFELRGGTFDIHTPSSYPRFGHVLSGKIPSCKSFTYFRGKGFVLRWKLELGVTYKLQFTIDVVSNKAKPNRVDHRLGFIFPFKLVSVQSLITTNCSDDLMLQSVYLDSISYFKNQKMAMSIPVRLPPSELSLEKINKKRSKIELHRDSLSEQFVLTEPIVLQDYCLIGMKISCFTKEKLIVETKTWDQPIPTGIYHTLVSSQKYRFPLVSYRIINNTDEKKKILLSTEIVDFTQKQRTTKIIPPKTIENIVHLPSIRADALKKINETRTTNIYTKAIEINESNRLISENTFPVQLLAYDTMIWEIKNPSTGVIEDLSNHLAAWVTPHTKDLLIDKIIRRAAEFHPQKIIVGYQNAGATSIADSVRSQVEAIYRALKELGITYIDASICFGTDTPNKMQRIKLPADSISSRSANCVDGSVLLASALEHIGLNLVIVLVPNHAFIGWEESNNSGRYEFLETTLIGKRSFQHALKKGKENYETMFLGSPSYVKKKILKIDLLRKDKIFPMC